ncbi:phosphoribosylanthranilate isomerase [Fructilactobacillus sp. Tb1]|uniref:phosphoribosylanthranilate isomerase n=1 Tax=Fructilactobacillus sp. Tb1 TaxID=3422304 RepID=UPI003D2B868F
MVKIKICGVQTLADVDNINQVQPDLIGFVFAPSKRQIGLKTAQQLREQLNPDIISVGVYVGQTTAEIKAALEQQIISQVQYYGKLPNDLIQTVHNLNGEIIQVVTDKNEINADADYVMFDASKGRGIAAKAFTNHHLSQPEYLSGGINLTNVAEAVKTTQPIVVDVSSSTETDGHKDLIKMQALTDLVHQL